MTGTAELRALLVRLITDGAHHSRCAGLSRHPEGRLAHDGFAAGFHIAAVYVADVLATGSIQARGGHVVRPEDEAAAQHVAASLPGEAADRARLIGDAIRQSAS